MLFVVTKQLRKNCLKNARGCHLIQPVRQRIRTLETRCIERWRIYLLNLELCAVLLADINYHNITHGSVKASSTSSKTWLALIPKPIDYSNIVSNRLCT